MIVLPLQSVAAVLAPLRCVSQTQAAIAMPCHGEQEQSAVADTGNDEHGNANHQCCHYSYTGVSTPEIRNLAQKISDVAQFIIPLATLFIPDSPDRPPRG